MKKVDIFDDEDSITIDSEFDTTNFTFYPEDKKFEVGRSIKNDCFYSNQTLEYKLSINPVELQIRTLESSHEPPLEYSIKDGVVLESELMKKDMIFPDRVENLKKDIEWQKVPIFGNYQVNLYILSKHPEILSKEEYRKFLRQSVERIKIGVSKVEKAIKDDAHGLQVIENRLGGKGLWYPQSESEKKEMSEYLDMSKEKQRESKYAKKLEYVEKIRNSLFVESSPKYVGISDPEFRVSDDLINYLEGLLEQKEVFVSKKEKEGVNNLDFNKKVSTFVYLLTAFFILLKLTDGIYWNWFDVLSPVLIWKSFCFIRSLNN